MENNNDFNIIDFNSAEKKAKKAQEAEVEALDDKVEEEEEKEDEKKSKEKKSVPLHFSSKQTKLIAAICIILAVLIIGATTCIINDINPVSYTISVLTGSSKKLVNKWQSQDAPGITAYEFHDDGTYDSHTLGYVFHGEYETKGDRLILRRSGSKFAVEYKYSIKNDVLTMTLYKEGSRKLDKEKQKQFKYDRVDFLNQKSLGELLNNALPENTTE